MNPANSVNQGGSTQKISQPTSGKMSISGGVGGKEAERSSIITPEAVQISHEMELPKELEKAGVSKFRETIELPPDLRKIGVSQIGANLQVTPTLPKITLPVSDVTVAKGLHAPILSALRWLAVWCVKKLKKAHVKLRVIHGKVVRVKSD